ncbi:MAG: FeoB-associated Cys-rich membrane protein [Chitinophagaceae bacterium]|nr:FeoB-associated Cys-rich membrane protein [Chitinophagaceae bacterium]
MHFIVVDINWPVIIVVGLAVIGLLIFLIRRNQKDEKDMEETMNQVDKKPLDHDQHNEKS